MQTISLFTEPFFKKTSFYQIFSTDPIGYIDVGARFGVHALVDPLHPFLSFLGFEPDTIECQRLNNDATLKKYFHQCKILEHALGASFGKETLHITRLANNSSLLRPSPLIIDRYQMHEKWQVIDEYPVNTTPLDHILYDLKLGFPHSGEIIKLDTQGTEYEILEGAKRLLKEKTLCIVSEVEFCEIYQNQKLFSDVERYLRDLNFQFYGFLNKHSRTKKMLNKREHFGRERLFYADAVFFKDPLSLSLTLNARHYAVLILSAILTQFYDYALELICHTQNPMTDEDKTSLQQLVLKISYQDPEETKKHLHVLMDEIAVNDQNTNVHLGKLIDKLKFPNFEDC